MRRPHPGWIYTRHLQQLQQLQQQQQQHQQKQPTSTDTPIQPDPRHITNEEIIGLLAKFKDEREATIRSLVAESCAASEKRIKDSIPDLFHRGPTIRLENLETDKEDMQPTDLILEKISEQDETIQLTADSLASNADALGPIAKTQKEESSSLTLIRSSHDLCLHRSLQRRTTPS